MKGPERMVWPVVMLCFFVSGMAGLVYQVVWARYLALFLGHTSYAVVAVLVAFMGGLALGNAWFGFRADRTRKPLALYGWLELVIGIYALIFPTYYLFCHEAFVRLARAFQPGSASGLLLKFGFSFLTILLPTVLMGATFPVLTKFVTRALSELRQKVAALYAINSAGAVAGCLVGDFWWIPTLGLEVTMFGGAALNIGAGIIALGMSRRIQEGVLPSSAPATLPPERDEQFTPAELRLAVIGIGLSGFCAMLYEVAWTRLLGLVLGSSTHAFSLMLVTFITGIAVGAWIICFWKKPRGTLQAFAWAEIALAGTLLVSMFFYEELPFWFSQLTRVLARRPEAYPIYQLTQAMICFGVMFIPTVCLGMTLPLVSRIATAELSRTGRSVGAVFAVNTIGTVLGAVATGLWLMPALTLPRTLAVGIAINAAIGCMILWRDRLSLRHWVVGAASAAALVWLAGILFQGWAQTFSLGLWRIAQPPATREQYRRLVENMEIKFHRDGAGATVTVVTEKGGDRPRLALNVNGKTDASLALDMPTQLLMGHLPLLLRPQSQQALVVGLGSGMTCSALARHPTVQNIDAVEILPDVVEAARWFGPYNDEILDNPKLRVLIEDAKSFLKITDKQYDVIVSEPSNPWMAGVAGVFSLEYYQSCSARLKPGGIVAQWVQMYETSDEILNLVLRTFTSVFPYTSIWRPASGDLILIGTLQPFTADLEAMERRFNEPSVKADLERVELTRFPVLLAREVISQQNGLFVAPPEGLIHSDFFPVLEYHAQEALFAQPVIGRIMGFDESYSPRPTTLLGQHLRKHSLTDADFKAFGRFYLEHKLPDPDLFRSILLRWQHDEPESTLPMELMAQAAQGLPISELEVRRLAPMVELLMKRAETDPEPLRMYEGYLMQTYRAQRSAFYLPPTDELQKVLERLLVTNPANQRVFKLHLAELAWDRGDDAACFQLAEGGFDPDVNRSGNITFAADPQAPRLILFRMAESLLRAGKLADAANLCQQAKQQRYTGTDSLLDLACRKIEAYTRPPAAN